MKSKPWQRREGNTAYCDRCGAVSQYRFMARWYSVRRAHSCHYTYWRWWQGFKKAHKKCLPSSTYLMGFKTGKGRTSPPNQE